MSAPIATVLIPAHNESALIGRTLAPLRGDARFRVIVVANGCNDATAAEARAALPSARVIETPVPSKTSALNLGYGIADARLPLICLDADLRVTPNALASLIVPFEDGRTLAACGQMQPDTHDASPLVRAYYRAWALNPYFAQGKFGGLFALSPQGAARVFPLPEVIADDEWVRRSFSDAETAFVGECRWIAEAAHTLAALVAVRRRSLRGTRAVTATLGPRQGSGTARQMLRAAISRPDRWSDMAVFIAVAAAVRLMLAVERPSEDRRWERDATTREARA